MYVAWTLVKITTGQNDIEKTACYIGKDGLYEDTCMSLQCPWYFHVFNGPSFWQQNYQESAHLLGWHFGVWVERPGNMDRLRTVFQRPNTVNLNVKPEIRALYHWKLRSLDYIISSNGSAPDKKKVKSIMSGTFQFQKLNWEDFLDHKDIIIDLLKLQVNYTS